MPYDIDYRESETDAADTYFTLTAKGAATPGNFQVPGNVSTITEIRVTGSVDYTADAHYGCSTAINLNGAGIGQGFQQYPGPCFGAVGAATFNAGLVTGAPEIYHTNIPVVPGGEIQAQGVIMGEDPGAAMRLQVNLVYDGIPGRIVDSDYRECDLTAANTPVRLNARGGVAVGSFKTTKRPIVEVRCNGGIKAVAGLSSCTTDYMLYGAGLVNAGNYNFEGRAYAVTEDLATGGAGSFNVTSVRHVTNIALKPGNLIDVDATMLNTDLGSIWAIFGLQYG